MTTIENLQKEESYTTHKHAYSAKLAATLGNGADWEYRGGCFKKYGFCACGHDILFNFPIHHKTTGQCVIVGSSCVNTFPGINPQVVERIAEELKKIDGELRAAKKRARELEQDTTIIALRAELDELNGKFDRFRDQYEEGIRLPYNVWYFLYSYKKFQWFQKEYVSRGALIAKIRKQIAQVKNFISENNV